MARYPNVSSSLWLAWASLMAAAAPCLAQEPVASLADDVPDSIGFFVEVRDAQTLWTSELGRILNEWQVADLLGPAGREATQPASKEALASLPWWQQLFARSVGIESAEITEQLLSGRIALAADSWSGVASSVLLSHVEQPDRLVSQLADRRIAPGEAGEGTLRFRLDKSHELALMGQTALVGRNIRRADLYRRILLFWREPERASLGSSERFQASRLGIDPGSPLLVHVAGSERKSVGRLLTKHWPERWPALASMSAGIRIDNDLWLMETVGEAREDAPLMSVAPPVNALLRLPDTAVAAWTQAVRPIARGFDADDSGNDSVSSLLSILRGDMPPEVFEGYLLDRFVSDAVVIVDQLPYVPAEQEHRPTVNVLLLPAVAVSLEVDQPTLVERSCKQILSTLADYLNRRLELDKGESVEVHSETLDWGGEEIHSIDLGALFGKWTDCEFLSSLKLSFTLADRWLVAATHPQTVRRVVQARRGFARVASPRPVDEAWRAIVQRDGRCRSLTFVRAERLKQMLESWMRFVDEHHPELSEPAWWRRVHSEYASDRERLGMEGRVVGGTILVVSTEPGFPAYDKLLPGDRIVAVDRTRLDPDQPAESFKQLVAKREHPESLRILVDRDGSEIELFLSLPTWISADRKVMPLELLSRLAGSCDQFEWLTHATWQSDETTLHSTTRVKLPDRPLSP